MKIKDIVDKIKSDIDSESVKNKILSDRGVVMKNGKCKCFSHTPSADTVMSFYAEGKKFKCFSCGYSIDLIGHYQEFYNLSFMEAIKAIVSDFNLGIDIIINQSERKPKKAPKTHTEPTNVVIDYIRKRGISKKVADMVGVKEDKGNVCFEYRNEFGEHVANKYRKTKKSEGPKMWFEAGTNINTLFNMDNIDITKPLLITEGEFDCLASIQAGFKNAVSIPSGVNGTGEWITSNWTWLEQFDEIIIFFDNDEPGIKGAREVFNRLVNKSVRIAKIEGECKDINELLIKEGVESILKAIQLASTPTLAGVATLDEVEDFDIYEAEKLETGITNIDNDILGMVFGSLVVFTGRNGSGKSTMLNQVFIGEPIRQGYKTFLFSGELVAGNVKEWLVRTLANESHLIEFTAKNGNKYKRVSTDGKREIVKAVKDKFYLYDNDNYNIDALIDKMTVLATRYGVKVFNLDNLMVIGGKSNDKYENQEYIVQRLKAFAKKHNVIVILVAHPKKTQNEEIQKDDISGISDITNLADYVVSIDRNFKEDREYGAKLSVLKNRHTGVNSYQKLRFDMDRRRFYSSSEMLELGVNYLEKEEFIEVQGVF